ncbi:MAG: uroporphyrinogen-III decarboxylase-like protein [Lentisphaerae bacterium]|jgi:uroporphyrinogen decarboxylase|nr:uroporphyrinogen-III decarboxylase-like protein [Lentisphaerota bacterium]MBT4822303.1 uroporphyrinogen-III decarboxylase-like protein [Lentisphaerota bacterium]MBT5606828.1 uroporphyrinogen-III decarboxylase-like protein [Lentisphaerota bacterium]MBT7055770.1 uroporphyrinogen-III decarboxylase-like protein [Lentisphaerota bacterium]MBT7843095.1 uroporphyrinogen-III decarboxylase-like protein [Lentisphaerota bacterium]
MTNRERVIASLAHQQPDKTPYQIGFTQKAMAAMVAYCGGNDFLGDMDNCAAGLVATPGPKCQAISETVRQDEFGVQWDRSIDRDIGNVCNCVLPERDLSALELPNPSDPSRFAGFAERCTAAHDAGRFVQFSIGFSLFERAWTLRGMENLFIDMMETPEFVEELLDAICDYNVAMVEQAVAYDIDAVHFGDDWGSQLGLLMGKDAWERFLMPRLARQYGVGKQAGKFVTIHSCGKVQEVFPQLIEIGLDCFNPFQPEVMDVYEMKRLYGDRLSFWGGISTQKLLPYGTPDDVRAEARRMMAEVGRDGGLILAPAHGIPGDAKPENILALIETVNDQ